MTSHRVITTVIRKTIAMRKTIRMVIQKVKIPHRIKQPENSPAFFSFSGNNLRTVLAALSNLHKQITLTLNLNEGIEASAGWSIIDFDLIIGREQNQ